MLKRLIIPGLAIAGLVAAGFGPTLQNFVPSAAAQTTTIHDALQTGGQGRISHVVDGDTVILTDGRSVRLVGIQAPKLPLDRPNFKTWPMGEKAREELAVLALVSPRPSSREPSGTSFVTLAYGGQKIDRYGRALAHLYRHDPETGRQIWLQGEMLARGLARVYSFRDNRALVPEMLALERSARGRGIGIWSLPFYSVRTAAQSKDHINNFGIVEDVVFQTAVVKGRTFLNFTDDWRSDFTVVIAPKNRRLFENAGVKLDSLAGQTIRVRGWIKNWNGPMIEIDHPEQLEILTINQPESQS